MEDWGFLDLKKRGFLEEVYWKNLDQISKHIIWTRLFGDKKYPLVMLRAVYGNPDKGLRTVIRMFDKRQPELDIDSSYALNSDRNKHTLKGNQFPSENPSDVQEEIQRRTRELSTLSMSADMKYDHCAYLLSHIEMLTADDVFLVISTYACHRWKFSSSEVTAISSRMNALPSTSITADQLKRLFNSIQYLNNSKESDLLKLLESILPILQNYTDEITPDMFSFMINGLRHLSSHHLVVRTTIATLCNKAPTVTEISSKHLSRLLYSFSSMHSEYVEVQSIVKLATNWIQVCRDEFTPYECALCLHGAKRLKSSDPFIETFIIRLADVLHRSEMMWSEKHIGIAFRGIQELDCTHTAVKYLLKVLLIKILTSQGPFSGATIGSVLYSLKNMSSEHSEVCDILKVIRPHLKRASTPLSGKDIGSAFFGIRNLSMTHPHVSKVFKSLSQLLETHVKEIDGVCLGAVLYGLQGCDPSHKETVRVLMRILPHLKSCRYMNSVSVCMSLYGLQNLNSDIPEAVEVLNLLTQLLMGVDGASAVNSVSSDEFDPKSEEKFDVWSDHHISSALYGLQGMHSDRTEVTQFLVVFHDKISQFSGPLSAQAMANAVYGLQNMSSNHVGVLKIVGLLASLIRSSSCTINGQAIGNMLYGMRNLSSDHDEVRALLAAIHEKIQFSLKYGEVKMTAQGICNALYGLHHCTSDCVEALNIIRVLSPLISSTEGYTSQGISNALYGLGNMSSECQDVRNLLTILYTETRGCPDEFSGLAIGSSLYGLRMMSNKHQEVRRILRWLAVKLARSRDEMDGASLCMSLYGLNRMTSSDLAVLNIVHLLAEKLSTTTQRVTGHHLTCGLYGLRNMNSESTEVRHLLRVVTDKLQKCDGHISQMGFDHGFYGIANMSLGYKVTRNLYQVLEQMELVQTPRRFDFSADDAIDRNAIHDYSHPRKIE